MMSATSRRVLIVLLFAGAAVFVRLGFWQLDRLQERRAANRVAAEARAAPAVRLPEEAGVAGDLAYRRIEASGRYDHENEIVLRGASFSGSPGVLVVTPLRLPGTDTALLVSRGFVPAPDAITADLDSLREEGERTVEGVGQPIPAAEGKPVERGGRTTWARLDAGALAEWLPYPIYPVYVRQAPDSALPRLPRRLPPPALDDGPHLSYAVQWFSFAAMAVVFAVIVVARRDRTPGAPS